MAQIPLKDLVPVPRQKIVTDRAGESSATLVRTVQGSPLSSRWTGADEGSGIVTLDLQKVAGLGSNAAPALLALQYDSYGRIVAVKPAQVDYNSLTNLPNLPALIANEVQSQISALNLLDAAAVRHIVVERVDTLRINLEELIRQLTANLQPGMSEEQVRQIVAEEVGKLKLPISWTSEGIIAVIKNAIASGQIVLPGGVNIDLTQYFNSTEGGVLLRQIIQQVVSAMLPDFLRQWFVDNPLDKPDQHLFAYSGDGTIAGFIGNQTNRYRYGNPQLLAIERLPNGEVSPFFHDVAAAGDEIELRGPLGGHFLWPEPTDKPVLLIGAGSGVVPLMAMIRQRRASAQAVPVALLLSARTAEDVLFSSELHSIEMSDPTFILTLAITREAPKRASDYGRRIDDGMVQATIARLGRDPGHVFVCGSNGFVNIATDSALSAGLGVSIIKTERYGG